MRKYTGNVKEKAKNWEKLYIIARYKKSGTPKRIFDREERRTKNKNKIMRSKTKTER